MGCLRQSGGRSSAVDGGRASCRLRPGRGHQNKPAAASKMRCAAQAEYGRLAAQAYSPSDAMSQAAIGLDGIQKVQRLSRQPCRAEPGDETGARRLRSWYEGGGGSSRFFPAVSDLAASPHAAGSFGLDAAGRTALPATSLPCRQNAGRNRGRCERRCAGIAPLRPCTSGPRPTCWRSCECRRTHRRCRCV